MDTAAETLKNKTQVRCLFDLFASLGSGGETLKTTSALIVWSIDKSAVEMATGEENVTGELKKLMLDLKKAAAKLHTLFDCYDSKNYPVNILRTNKESWMKKIDEAMTSVTEACLEFQFLDDVPDASKAECKDILKDSKAKFVEFVTDFNIKILADLTIDHKVGRAGSVASRGGQSTNSEKVAKAARVAEINVDIDHKKISKDVKDLSAELNKFEDWSKVEPHETEVAMLKIEGWQKKAKQIQD